jgi:hypothetical protein
MVKFEFWQELVLVKFMEEGVSYYAKHITSNGFLPKRIGFGCFNVELAKKKTKNSTVHWRPPGNTQAEPNLGFCLIRWAKPGLPRLCTGGTQFWDPPDPPVLKKFTVRVFDPRNDFQNFRKLLELKI